MQKLSLNRLSTVGLLLGISGSMIWVSHLLTLPSQAQSTPNRREFVNVDCVRTDDNIALGVTDIDAINCQFQRETELPLVVSTTPTPQALPTIDADTDPLERESQELRETVANEREIIVVEFEDGFGPSGQRLIAKGANRFDLLAGQRVIVTVETQSFVPEARLIGPLGQNRSSYSLSLQQQRPGVYQTVIIPNEDGEYRVRILSRNGNGQLVERNGGYTLSLHYE